VGRVSYIVSFVPDGRKEIVMLRVVKSLVSVGVVRELTERGVVFERYDEPGLKTYENGIATFEGEAKVAYLKDPDGHTLSIARPPRSS
jgi:hypothetical protein